MRGDSSGENVDLEYPGFSQKVEETGWEREEEGPSFLQNRWIIGLRTYEYESFYLLLMPRSLLKPL